MIDGGMLLEKTKQQTGYTEWVNNEGSKSLVTNWRDSTPTAGEHGGAVTWTILEAIDITFHDLF